MKDSDGDLAQLCFVISPIGNDLDPIGSPPREIYEQNIEVYEKVIVPACEAAGFGALRADRIDEPGEITDQVFRNLIDAQVVVADVTDGNPNVLYELGYRHAVGGCTIQIAEYGRLPFDISGVRTIRFVRTESGLIDCRKALQAQLIRVRDAGCTEVRRASNKAERTEPRDTRMPVTSDEVPVEPGFLDVLADMEGAFPELSEGVVVMAQHLQALTAAATNRQAQLLARGPNITISERRKIANELGEDMDALVVPIETSVSSFEASLSKVDAGMAYLLDRAQTEPEMQSDKGFLGFLKTVIELGVVAEQSGYLTRSLSGIIDSIGGISGGVRGPAKRIAGSLRHFAQASDRVISWREQVLRASHVLADQVRAEDVLARLSSFSAERAPGKTRRKRTPKSAG